MAHEERFKDGIRCMKRGKGAKGERRIGEVRGIQINTEDSVNTRKTGRRTVHSVSRWHKSVLVLIPRWCARKAQLNRDAENAHPTECFRKDRSRAWRSKDEHDEGAHSRCAEVHDAIRQPGQNIENRVLMRGKNVGQVCAVQNVLQSWENSHPNVWPVFNRDESAGEEVEKPDPDRK